MRMSSAKKVSGGTKQLRCERNSPPIVSFFRCISFLKGYICRVENKESESEEATVRAVVRRLSHDERTMRA